jgi:hypothetical protein
MTFDINKAIFYAFEELMNDDTKDIKSVAIDFLDGKRWEPKDTNLIFKKTNLAPLLLLRVDARMMFLDNTLFDQGICNGTIGVVTEVDDDT